MQSPLDPNQSPNPYSPPGAHAGPHGSWETGQGAFVPLGWRTTMAAVGIGAVCFSSFLLDATELVFADGLRGAEPDLGPSILTGVAGLALVAANIVAVVFFCVWLHCAAKNLRALGRTGMQFTPGWAIGWFFVPFSNLVKPLHAVTEVWHASNPNSGPDAYEWRSSPGNQLLSVWWTCWILGNVLSNVSARIDDPAASGAVGLAGSAVITGAAVACILLMRQISEREELAAARLKPMPGT